MKKRKISLDEAKETSKKNQEEEMEEGTKDNIQAEREELPHSWMKKVELPMFEGSDLLG